MAALQQAQRLQHAACFDTDVEAIGDEVLRRFRLAVFYKQHIRAWEATMPRVVNELVPVPFPPANESGQLVLRSTADRDAMAEVERVSCTLEVAHVCDS